MTEDAKSLSGFIWADKVALLFALLSGLVWAAFWGVAFLAIGDSGAKHLWLHLGLVWTNILLLALMSAWLVMRAVDFAAGGATYRLLAQNAPGLEAWIAKAGHGIVKFAHLHGPQTAR